ncbi:hypothetical protein DS031_04095 [Bacillus taeanensis]|uniref:Phosphatidic acid phosphatase type 2/haloperoxidase domain-containing protein n=1 Tax=Bacillus taeanensis TaxID=273032 RepID=A0A366XX04_9BACI|nr:hypothetical protein DS031_04095 [Bacillus taeanensis]
MAIQKQYLFWLVLLLFVFLLLSYIYHIEKVVYYDKLLLQKIYQLSGTFIDLFFIFITHLGSKTFTYPMLGMLAIIYLLKRHYVLVFCLAVNLFGVRELNWLLKTWFERSRPDLEAVVRASYYSFPSGHAMNSTAFYGFLAYIVWRRFKKNSIWFAAFLLVLLIGLSRIYLGVHYPIDVAAGISAGAAWTILIIVIYEAAVGREMNEACEH